MLNNYKKREHNEKKVAKKKKCRKMQCCRSGMFIPDPGFGFDHFWYPGSGPGRLLYRIPDPDPTNERREKLN
jgi:hypothetical protein